MTEVLFEGDLVELKVLDGKGLRFKRNWAVCATRTWLSLHHRRKHPPRSKIRFDEIVWIAYKDESDMKVRFDMLQANDDSWKDVANLENLELQSTAFIIGTSQLGFDDGRRYIFKTPTVLQRELWVLSIRNLTWENVHQPLVRHSAFERGRHKVTLFYLHPWKGYVMAFITMLNFLEIVTHMQLSSSVNLDPNIDSALQNFESAMAFIFLAEIIAYFGTGMRCDFGTWMDALLTILSAALTFVPSDSPSLEYFQVQFETLDLYSMRKISDAARFVQNSRYLAPRIRVATARAALRCTPTAARSAWHCTGGALPQGLPRPLPAAAPSPPHPRPRRLPPPRHSPHALGRRNCPHHVLPLRRHRRLLLRRRGARPLRNLLRGALHHVPDHDGGQLGQQHRQAPPRHPADGALRARRRPLLRLLLPLRAHGPVSPPLPYPRSPSPLTTFPPPAPFRLPPALL